MSTATLLARRCCVVRSPLAADRSNADRLVPPKTAPSRRAQCIKRFNDVCAGPCLESARVDGQAGMPDGGALGRHECCEIRGFAHGQIGAPIAYRLLKRGHRAASKNAAESFAKSERKGVVFLRRVERPQKGLRFFVVWVRHSRLNPAGSLQGRARTFGCEDANFTAESSQRLRVRHEGTEMACALRRGKEFSCHCLVARFENLRSAAAQV